MSKYIPGNQKHLTLDNRIYIENELNKGTSFKDIARFLCKDPTTISKEVKAHRLSDWYHIGTFYNAHNFCIHRYHCKKTNACGKIVLCGIKCASAPLVTRLAKTLRKNFAADWKRPLTFVMAVRKKSTIAPLHTNIFTTPALQTGSIAKNSGIPGLEST
ncbi:helix-turn-helix domain-containing protein [Roseburia hominis]